MISNYVSLFLCFVEIFLFGGLGWGFPFVQYVLEEEFIFSEEKCANNSAETPTLCIEAKQQYNTVFTVSLVTCVSGLLTLLFYSLTFPGP